jgi:hypothetical protein
MSYVIPLATKLKSCGVFGVSSDEYMNYAQESRREWAAGGKEIISINDNNKSPKVDARLRTHAVDLVATISYYWTSGFRKRAWARQCHGNYVRLIVQDTSCIGESSRFLSI